MPRINYLVLSLISLNFISNGMAIVNGKPGYSRQFNFMAKIQMCPYGHCSGAIISERHILTAGHCVNKYRPYELKVTIDAMNLAIELGISRGVLRIHLHPGFESGIEEICFFMFIMLIACECVLGPIDYKLQPKNDIAVLLLMDKLPLGYRIQPVKLPTARHPSQCSATCQVSGWGLVRDDATEPSEILQYAIFRTADAKECLERGTRYRDHGEFCALDEEGKAYLAPGDSGGPFVCDNVVYGVVSSGQMRKPAVFVEVFDFMEFIETKMREDEELLAG